MGFIIYTSRYSKKEKRFSISFDLKHCWNLVLYFLFFCAHKLYNIKLKLRKHSVCVSKTYFLLKTFCTRFHPSRRSIFTKFLQKYDSSIPNVLNIDENPLQIQTAINILDHFHSSLCRKKICRGLNTLLIPTYTVQSRI